GSHHTFRRDGVEEKINLQRDKGKAKVYQVRQVRAVIVKYGLGEDEGDAQI
ncbi:MAG: type II toxin-antitoxin system HicA family toxin, partial [Acidobacteriota bacterium]|nr:type II toxin-antitoxin system HicA family toxin [Acidobacteriota bacterium]